MRRGLPLALLLLALPLGCPDEGPGPDAAFQAFVSAAAAGDHDRAWSMLSEDTRKTADAMVDASRDALIAAGETPPENGKAFLFGSGLEMVRELDAVRVRSLAEDRAMLEVTATGGEALPVEMRLEGGAWRVVLPL